MSKCNKQKLSKKAMELIANTTKNHQDLKFNNLQVTTTEFDASETLREAFVRLFSDNASEVYDGAKVIEDAIKGDSTKADPDSRFDVAAKMRLVLDERSGDRGILGILNLSGDKDADTLVEDTIAMHIALDSIQSEEDTQKSAGVAQGRLDEINRTGVPTSYLRLAPTIGRAIAIAKGKILVGSRNQNHANYAKLGMEVLERLVAEELLNKDESAQMVMGDFKLKTGLRKGGIQRGMVTIKVNEKKFSDYIPAATDDKKSSTDLLRVLKQLSRITNPYTELAPSNEASSDTKTAHNKSQIESTTDTMKKVQEGAMGLSPSVITFMSYLKEIYDRPSGEYTFETTLKKEFGMDKDDDFLADVFGITLPKGEFTDKSAIGVKTSRMGPLVGLMQNFSTINVEEFFLTYKQANNSRFFQRENILNVQSDKKMARNIIDSTVEFEYTGEDLNDLVARIGVEYSIPKAVITGENTENDLLETLLNLLDEDSAENQYEIFKQITKVGNETGIKADSPWAVHKALRAIADVRKGHKEGKVKTKIMLESDASGSGPLLKLLQNMHKDDAIAVLKRLRLLPTTAEEIKDLGGELADFYQLAQETYYKLEEKAKEKDKKFKGDEKSSLTLDIEKVKAIMELTGHGTDFRSFIKDPTIRLTYSQAPTSNMRETATLLAEEIVTRGSSEIEKAIKVLGLEKTEDLPAFDKKLNKEQQTKMVQVLSKELQGTVAKFIVSNVLEPTFNTGLFDGTKITINKIFEVIKRQIGTTEEIVYRYMEPSVVLDWIDKDPANNTMENFPYAENKKYRLIGDKRTETLIGTGKDAMMIPLYHDNDTSAQILPIHAMDAAILVRAITAIYKEVNKIKGLEGLTPKDISILLVHDATILPPRISKLVETAYEQEIINASMNYDVVYMMLREATYKAALKEQEAMSKRTGKKVPLKEITLEELALKYPDLGKIIPEAIAHIQNKQRVLNVNSEGIARKLGEEFKVVPNSFATNLDDTEFTKIKDPKNPLSKDGINILYEKRRSKHKGKKKVPAKPKPTPKEVSKATKVSEEELAWLDTTTVHPTSVTTARSVIVDQATGNLVKSTSPVVVPKSSYDAMPVALRRGLEALSDKEVAELKLKIDKLLC